MCQFLTELERHIHAIHYQLGYGDHELQRLCHDLALRVDLEHLPEKCLDILLKEMVNTEDDVPF